PQRACVPPDHRLANVFRRRGRDHLGADRHPRHLRRIDGRPRPAGVPHAPGHGHARHCAEPAGGRPDGHRRQPRDRGHLRHRGGARRGGRRALRHLLRPGAIHHGLHPGLEGLFRRGAGRHRQHSGGDAGRHRARAGRGPGRRLNRRLHRPVPVRLACPLHRRLRRRRPFHPVRLELPGRIRVRGADPRAGVPAAGFARRESGRSRLMHALFDTRKYPWLVWVGFALIGIALALLPFALAQVGTSWVRITNYAILYILLALGLNIVVGFAGLLDLGYIAFYAVGAYTYALLASPQFGLHLPFWLILPIGAAVAAFFGLLLGAPTLKLRGDYLAIVTLGFGEIIRIFLNNLSRPINITNGPQGIARIDPFRLDGFSFGSYETFLGIELSGPIKYYYLLLAVVLGVIVVNVRLQNSRVGRAWEAIREDEIAARSMG